MFHEKSRSAKLISFFYNRGNDDNAKQNLYHDNQHFRYNLDDWFLLVFFRAKFKLDGKKSKHLHCNGRKRVIKHKPIEFHCVAVHGADDAILFKAAISRGEN